MKYIIWGAGVRGKRVFRKIGDDDVLAFIDEDKLKVGNKCCGKDVINYEEYKRKYSNYYIVISCSHENEVIEKLNRDNNLKYFLLSECPGEFQESNHRNLLRQYMIKYWSDGEENVLYGITLYTFIINKWIKRSTGNYLKIVIPDQSERTVGLEQSFPEINFCSLSQVDFSRVTNILVVNERDLPILEGAMDKKVNIVNVYDCSDKIVAYYNPEIVKFHNRHQGERCFIVATGPSLDIRDLEMLKQKNEVCISMNSIWKGFSKTNWRPDYYVADDPRVMIEDEEALEHMDVRYIFLGDTCKEYWKKKHKQNILWHHFVNEYSEDRFPKFSEDFSKKCYMGSTVTYSCIQLAIYMGFKEIYLLGVDFSYADSSGDTKYPHFYEEKELEAIGFVKQVRLAYLKAKKYADEHGIKIYNATRGGKLETFERVDFDKVLS